MQDKIFIGVDIGGTNITAGLLVNNILIKKAKKNTEAERSRNLILETLFNVIREVWRNDVMAIGIGVPGFLDVKNGIILQINNIPSFSGINLTNEVSKEFNIPVYINNDANCFVLGESYFGAGSNYSNIVGITLGTGLGGGIVIEGNLISGIYGGAGEFGCIPYLDGTFEDYCSGKFFKQFYASSGEDLFLSAENGDVKALEAFEHFGQHVGSLIVEIMYFIAPEAIIIGGSVAKSYKYFEQSILKRLSNLPEEHLRRDIKIAKAELIDAPILGAAAGAINKISNFNNQIEHSVQIKRKIL